jgi:transposase
MPPKNNPIIRRKYDRTGGPATFKADVLKMITNGQSVAYVAQALGISEALISNRDGL